MLPTQYQEYIALSKYARWREKDKRRETWNETIDRWEEFWIGRYPQFQEVISNKLKPYLLELKVMPSMRTLMSAGKALDEHEVAGFNCSAVAVDDVKVFDEILYVLMCGTGVGFSCERQFISKLPEVAENFYETDTTIIVHDSKIGWSKAYRELISLLYQGQVPKWDVSKVRPAGARLKTFGGRASGPEPLVDLFRFTIQTFKKSAGRKLKSIEVHDIICKIAAIVVVGSVRRSALISLSNLSDQRMRDAKAGQWWVENPQRALANNSVAYTEKPEMGIFMEEWKALYDSKSGERGIYNRDAVNRMIPDRRKELGYTDFLCNPCSEINLRSGQFCNLSELVVRSTDTEETLLNKVEIAAIIGTFQATLTNFKYLSKRWKHNTELEALLGGSMTGIMDNPLTYTNGKPLEELLTKLKNKAIETNEKWSLLLGINPATAITCVKPSGTVSQLVDSASGIHPRFAPYYIRTVRADKKDPLARMMVDKGFPVEDDVMNPSGLVFSFPIKAPESAVFVKDVTAISQLELWKTYQKFYTEHKPSITVYVGEDEWMTVGAWVYDNFDIMSGVSFLPRSEHTYKQAPYQEIDEATYNELVSKMPTVDWSELSDYETTDEAVAGTKEYACTAGHCELV